MLYHVVHETPFLISEIKLLAQSFFLVPVSLTYYKFVKTYFLENYRFGIQVY